MRILVTGGGTAGHVTPIQPVVSELHKLDSNAQIVYVYQRSDRFAKLLKKDVGLHARHAIFAGKIRRYKNESATQQLLDIKTHLLNIRDLLYLMIGTIQSLNIIRKNKPDVVFSKGGYVSVPLGVATKILGVPLVVHESDALPGLANRFVGRWARYIAAGMPVAVYSGWMHDKLIYTGIPVREQFSMSQKMSKSAIIKHLHLEENKKILVVTGGSLGAGAINEAIATGAENLLRHCQIVHITGEDHAESIEEKIHTYTQQGYRVIPFTNEIDQYFRVADLIVTRASGTTTSELALLAVPTVLIPAAQLSDQQVNARIFSEHSAAIVLEEASFIETPLVLSDRILEILADADQRSQLAQNLHSFAKPHAARDVAELIMRAVKS